MQQKLQGQIRNLSHTFQKGGKMATDEKKKENMLRMTQISLTALTTSVWDALGESSFALTTLMGDRILEMFEKEMGLEIAGESTEAVIREIQRIFVDEFGYAQGITTTMLDGGNKIELRVSGCVNRLFTNKLLAAGVQKPYICPIMNATVAALRRMGYKVRNDIQPWSEQSGSIITLTKV
jgi:hypothetical protein